MRVHFYQDYLLVVSPRTSLHLVERRKTPGWRENLEQCLLCSGRIENDDISHHTITTAVVRLGFSRVGFEP